MKNMNRWLIVMVIIGIISTTAQGAAEATPEEAAAYAQRIERDKTALRAIAEVNASRHRAENEARAGAVRPLDEDEMIQAAIEESLKKPQSRQGSAQQAKEEKGKREEYVFPEERIQNLDRQFIKDRDLYWAIKELRDTINAERDKKKIEKMVADMQERVQRILDRGANPNAIMLDKNNKPVSIIDIARVYLGRQHSIVTGLESNLKTISSRLRINNAKEKREKDKRWPLGESGAAELKKEHSNQPSALADIVKGYAQSWWTDKNAKIKSQVLRGHTYWVRLIAISPDNSFIVTGSGDRTARIWNRDGTQRAVLAGEFSSVAISPDSSYIVTGSLDNTVRICDSQTGAVRNTLSGHTDSIISVAISPDNKFIVTGSYDHTARIWDGQTGELLHTLSGHAGEVISVAISPDSSFIVTGSTDDTARIWRLE